MTTHSKTIGYTQRRTTCNCVFRQLLNTAAGFAPVPTGSGEEQELGVFAGRLSHDPCRASIADTTMAAEFAHLIGIFLVLFQHLYLASCYSCERSQRRQFNPVGMLNFRKTCTLVSQTFELFGRGCLQKTCMLILPIFCTLHTCPGWENQKLQS